MWRGFLTGVFILAAGLPAEGQRLGPAPKGPRDASVPDTNDARGYVALGLRVMRQDPQKGADAFYWAARLDPMSGEALYGRGIGLVMRNRGLLERFMRNRRTPNKDLRAVDSLWFQAYLLDPFLVERLQGDMWRAWIKLVVNRSASPSDQVTDQEIDYYLLSNPPRDADERAFTAYASGDYSKALAEYAIAMKKEKKKAWYNIERGRLFGRIGQQDSAIASLEAALVEMRAQESKDVVFLYNSKASVEHAIAAMHRAKDNIAAAKEAYGRALQEDLSYYPAHVGMGLIATDLKDSVTAMTELDLAAQVAPNEPYPHFMLAAALTKFGELDRAITAFERVIELEPFWAVPYAQLGMALEAKGRTPEAISRYEIFLARAARSNPFVPEVRARLAKLKS